MTNGEKLRSLRERTGMSIRAAAEAVGMKTPSNWQHYESDVYARDEFPADLTIRIANAFVGKGDPPVTISEVVDFCPTLRAFIAGRGSTYKGSISDENAGVRVSIDVEVQKLGQLTDLLSAFQEALRAKSKNE